MNSNVPVAQEVAQGINTNPTVEATSWMLFGTVPGRFFLVFVEKFLANIENTLALLTAFALQDYIRKVTDLTNSDPRDSKLIAALSIFTVYTCVSVISATGSSFIHHRITGQDMFDFSSEEEAENARLKRQLDGIDDSVGKTHMN